MSNILDEYLVKLGAVVDQSGLARFQTALRETSSVVTKDVQSMSRALLKVEAEMVGGFAAIGGAAVGLVDKVAMADQEFRLFALHMYMGKEQARSLKVAMDALGQPLENLAWDKELRERTQQLIEDQRAMAPNGDFDAQMRKVRDIRFEFTRMEVEVEYLGMHIVQDFMRALGLGPDTLLSKLRDFNTWATTHLPQISAWLAQHFLPIWRDIEMIGRDVGHVFQDFATIFDNVVGLLSGDDSLRGVASFEKFADATEQAVHGLAVITDWLVKITGLLTGVVVGGTVGSVIGGLIGLIAGIPGGPVTMIAGALTGAGLGGTIGAGIGGAAGGVFDLYRHYKLDQEPLSTLLASGGLASQDLLGALAGAESGSLGMSALSPKGAIGTMQLMPGTARTLGVNPYDAAQNVAGGTAYLNQLIRHYGGDVPTALGAYNAGPGRMDAFLAGKATLPDETRNYIGSVLGRAGQSGSVTVGTVVIQIQGTQATASQLHGAVKAAFTDIQAKQTQRNLAEFQTLGYSY